MQYAAERTSRRADGSISWTGAWPQESEDLRRAGETKAELRAKLKSLATDPGAEAASWHFGARLRNYFLTGLVIVGPVTITLYIAWWLINVVDAWVKPFLRTSTIPTPTCRFPSRASGCVGISR